MTPEEPSNAAAHETLITAFTRLTQDADALHQQLCVLMATNPDLDASKPLGRDVVCVLEEQVGRQMEAARNLWAAGLQREYQVALGHAAGFRAKSEELQRVRG
jgi:hypothetical protein